MVFQPGKPVKWGDMKSEITIEFSQKQWCVRLKRILWEGDRRCSSYFIYTSLYLLKECFALKQIELFNCLQSSYNVTNPMKPEDQSILVHPAATWLVLSLPPSIYLSIIFQTKHGSKHRIPKKNLNFYILHHQNVTPFCLKKFPHSWRQLNLTTLHCQTLWHSPLKFATFGHHHRCQVGWSINGTVGLENLQRLKLPARNWRSLGSMHGRRFMGSFLQRQSNNRVTCAVPPYIIW